MKFGTTALAFSALLGLATLSGCNDDDPMEDAVEGVEDAADDVGDGLEEAADDAEDAFDDAAD